MRKLRTWSAKLNLKFLEAQTGVAAKAPGLASRLCFERLPPKIQP